jgi:hypothetical protein
MFSMEKKFKEGKMLQDAKFQLTGSFVRTEIVLII